jgi:signal transduction histidine kinase
MLDLADALRPIADERRLTLDLQGPATFPIVGDATKTRRIVQNLVLNALKYTRQGGVTISWGDGEIGDARRWFIAVHDTGPGFHAGPGAPLAGALEVATEQARDVAADAVSGEVTHAKPAGGDLREVDVRPAVQQAGEGLGLSIVKRLCNLLDATMELDSVVNRGTTFRILFPKEYGV